MSKKDYYLLSLGTALMLVVFISINGSIDNQGEIYDLESRINDIEWKLEQ
jgi:hypothetical protein